MVFVEYAASDIITLSATVKSNGDYIEWPGLD